MTTRTLTLLVSLGLVFPALAGDDSNLPLSKEATLVESYSPTEVTIKATGMGKRDKDALIDLQKSAVFFVLFLGTDPLINTPEAKNKFEMIQEDFFAPEHIATFISWSADKVVSTVETRLPNKKSGVKITKMLRVNKQTIIDELTGKGIVSARDQVTAAIGMPFIMVIPDCKKGETPLEVFDSNPLAKQAAAVIESYLTARKYDVVVPRASEQINDMTKMQSDVKGAEEDPAYQIALALGSDVYIVFAGRVENDKASVQVRAYETTTARLLGTETGYSKTRPGVQSEVLVEEAIKDAADKVLSRVDAYWGDDVKKGSQYRLIFKLMGSFDANKVEEIQESASDAIDATFDLSKENIVTDKTLDYLVWAKKDEYKKGTSVFRAIKEKMAKTAKVQKININRKLLLLGIYPPE